MTLFKEIEEQFSDKDGRSSFFYRRAFRGLVTSYKNNPRKFISDEKKDREGEDENLLRKIPRMGHLMMFQYETESKNLKMFDEYPLVYVISIDGRSFTGCNLHYIHPGKRQLVVENLMEDRLNLPRNSVSKYSMANVGPLLDIAKGEWANAANLPIEDFVSIKDGKQQRLLNNKVWSETNKTFRDMIRGVRRYQGYGKNDSDFR
jgi:hypothetical protein|tara:strand:+ start:35 stop:646 length:612 start_codon:yes stop_codon:yes gene_type:complete